MESLARVIAFAILLAAMPVTAAAQEVEIVLGKAAAAMNGTNVKSVRFSVAGSGYEVKAGTSPSTWAHIRIESETREVDFQRPALQRGNRLITIDSPWEDQYELWTTPQAFLKGAI